MEDKVVCYNVCDLNTQRQEQEQAKLVLLKKGTQNYTNDKEQVIRLWKSQQDITKSREILIKVTYAQGTVGKVQNIPIKDNTSINEIHNIVTESYREAKISVGSRGNILSGVDVEDYRQMFYRLWANDNYLIHPRTSEFIIGTTLLERKRINVHKHTPHLKRFATVPYHNQINRTQISGKFVVQKHEKTIPTDIAKLQYVLDGKLAYKKTSQYKTVWATRYNRRR